MKPQYKHKCYHCKFLGQYTEEDQIYDLYYCPQLGHPTVVARYGDNEEDYISGLNFTLKPLVEAESRAIKEGLLSFNF